MENNKLPMVMCLANSYSFGISARLCYQCGMQHLIELMGKVHNFRGLNVFGNEYLRNSPLIIHEIHPRGSNEPSG